MTVISIDDKAATVTVSDEKGSRVLPLASPEAFSLVSRAWLRAGWDVKYVYGFSWLGRPVIQLPEDMIRIQEVIHALRPDVVLETGVAHGGSLVFYASVMKVMGVGRVVGVDIEIRPHNRRAIEEHPLKPLITLIEGSSVAPATVAAVKAQIKPGERVLVILDSNHTKAHVLAELDAYAPLVSVGSYAVACDGIMAQVAGGPRTKPEWATDNPTEAAKEFAATHPEFRLEEPPFPFNEGLVTERVTYWPGAFLKRVR
ncbi:MAG: class I SAM-dependent methyltransferase [Alphaproteobacteria bacterium]|nr:class I SAM-dependent methyltransferase [Alphaproteobacteria bacterium]